MLQALKSQPAPRSSSSITVTQLPGGILRLKPGYDLGMKVKKDGENGTSIAGSITKGQSFVAGNLPTLPGLSFFHLDNAKDYDPTVLAMYPAKQWYYVLPAGNFEKMKEMFAHDIREATNKEVCFDSSMAYGYNEVVELQVQKRSRGSQFTYDVKVGPRGSNALWDANYTVADAFTHCIGEANIQNIAPHTYVVSNLSEADVLDKVFGEEDSLMAIALTAPGVHKGTVLGATGDMTRKMLDILERTRADHGHIPEYLMDQESARNKCLNGIDGIVTNPMQMATTASTVTPSDPVTPTDSTATTVTPTESAQRRPTLTRTLAHKKRARNFKSKLAASMAASPSKPRAPKRGFRAKLSAQAKPTKHTKKFRSRSTRLSDDDESTDEQRTRTLDFS